MVKKGYNLSDLTKDPKQLIFLIFAVFTLVMLIPFTHAGYLFAYESMKKAPKGYEFPGVSDFWVTGVSSIVFACIDMVLRKVFLQLF